MTATVKKLVRSILLSIGVFVAVYALGLLGLALLGAGHGSPVLGYLFLSPGVRFGESRQILVGPFLWSVIFSTLPWIRKPAIKVMAIVLLFINIISAAIEIENLLRSSVIDQTKTSLVFDFIEKAPGFTILLIAVYLSMVLFVLFKALLSGLE